MVMEKQWLLWEQQQKQMGSEGYTQLIEVAQFLQERSEISY